MARKFLYLIAILIMLALAGTFAYRLFAPQLMRMAMVPGAGFKALPDVTPNAYADPAMWLARPGKTADNPALWAPDGYKPAPDPEAAVFFIHPTSFLERSAWNAPLDNKDANDRAALFIRGQASAFNESGAIWAPRYRQATFGAFLTSKADSAKALDLAYRDVAVAFDQFLKEAGPDRPIILAGHSQGALHLTRLLREKIAGSATAKQIVAAYAVGWPISRTTDLPLMGLPECTAADQSGCILGWQSFAEPAAPELILDTYNASTGMDGKSRKGTPILCTNPITGTPSATAPAGANLGTLIPSADLKTAKMQIGAVPARCDDRGILLIGAPPQLGPYVLPGNNYHVYDYSLFWVNIRADAARRLAAYKGAASR